MPKQRTIPQNKALHVYFNHLSEALNDAGFNVRKTLKHDFEIDWTPALIKELIWKQIQKSAYEKSSTRELTSGELQIIYDTINRRMAEKPFFLHVPFPSIEALVEEDKRTRSYSYPELKEEPTI